MRSNLDLGLTKALIYVFCRDKRKWSWTITLKTLRADIVYKDGRLGRIAKSYTTREGAIRGARRVLRRLEDTTWFDAKVL